MCLEREAVLALIGGNQAFFSGTIAQEFPCTHLDFLRYFSIACPTRSGVHAHDLLLAEGFFDVFQVPLSSIDPFLRSTDEHHGFVFILSNLTILLAVSFPFDLVPFHWSSVVDPHCRILSITCLPVDSCLQPRLQSATVDAPLLLRPHLSLTFSSSFFRQNSVHTWCGLEAFAHAMPRRTKPTSLSPQSSLVKPNRRKDSGLFGPNTVQMRSMKDRRKTAVFAGISGLWEAGREPKPRDDDDESVWHAPRGRPCVPRLVSSD